MAKRAGSGGRTWITEEEVHGCWDRRWKWYTSNRAGSGGSTWIKAVGGGGTWITGNWRNYMVIRVGC